MYYVCNRVYLDSMAKFKLTFYFIFNSQSVTWIQDKLIISYSTYGEIFTKDAERWKVDYLDVAGTFYQRFLCTLEMKWMTKVKVRCRKKCFFPSSGCFICEWLIVC